MSAGKRVFKLITNEVIFGEVEVVPTENGTEILVKKPYTASNGNIMPYMITEMGSSPAAVQIHPMNILWTVPLDEFPEANEIYTEVTSGIITEEPKELVL